MDEQLSSEPQMSVVIVTPDDYETIRQTIGHLREQTARDSLEIVIVAPGMDLLDGHDGELGDFLRYRVVAVGDVKSVALGNAAGVRQATAPVVAFVEEHSYPDRDGAEALIRAHRQPWAAVGPVVRNANPESAVSWADLLIAYGPWLEPARAGIVGHLPGHNSSYKREILLSYGPDLQAMLESESVLHWDLQAKGYQLYLEPAAKVYHLNFERLSSWVPAQFHSGRLFAAARARQWPRLRRLLYVAGAALIPLVRLWRILPYVGRLDLSWPMRLQVCLLVVLGLVVSAAGEVMGYAVGAGGSAARMGELEFHRSRHMAGTQGR